MERLQKFDLSVEVEYNENTSMFLACGAINNFIIFIYVLQRVLYNMISKLHAEIAQFRR